MDQKIIDLHEKFTHGLLDRREFLRRLAVFAGGDCCYQRAARIVGK